MEKKKKYLLVIGIFIILLSVVGLTYAYWTITLVQDGENIVYTDCLDIEFTNSNDITLNNAYPMTQDELETDFFPTATPYHFKLVNKCQNKTDLTINLETLEAAEPVLKDEYVNAILWEGEEGEKYSIEKTNLANVDYEIVTKENKEKLIPEALKAYTLYQFSLYPNESREFNLILFMDEDTPVSSDEDITNNAHWKSKVTINGQSSIETTGMLRKIKREVVINEQCMVSLGDLKICSSEESTDTEGMWGYSEQITEIVFENELNPDAHTENGVLSFDESALKDESVMSYLVPTGDTIPSWDAESVTEKIAYRAYIQGKNEILANFDSSHLFDSFSNVESIKGINYLNTTNVTDMHAMFSGLVSLTELKLGDQFDTSNVTDMSVMFSSMLFLETLNLGSQFNTSKVTNMYGMFSGMSALTTLDLNNYKFDTSQVTDMSYMFSMSALTELDLGSQFNTSNVKDMSYMFSGTSALTTLDLNNYKFDTSQVTDMSSMFSEMYNLTELNLGNQFDTSNVTNMIGMFSSMESLTKLDLGSQFNTINVKDMNHMFSDMNALTELKLGDQFNTSQVTDMSYMFSSMSVLPKLNLGNYFDTRNVGKDANFLDYSGFYGMFSDDTNLNLIQYGENFVRMNDANVDNMFFGCPSELEKPKDISWKDTEWYSGT